MATPKKTKTQVNAEQDQTLLNILKERAQTVAGKAKVNQNRSFALLAARDELFFRQLEDFTSQLFKANPIKMQIGGYVTKKSNKPVKRELNVVLSDLHIGANLDPRELPHKYGAQEESRRLAKIAKEIVEYKTQYRDHTHLNVNLIGDIIQGVLEHDPRDGNPLAEQCGAAMHLLIQTIGFLAVHFPKITVRCVPGNHGRNVSRHKARAMHAKWDSYENIIYSAIKAGVAHLPNVTVEIPYSPFYIYDSLGHFVMATHGDTFIEVGNPGSLINVKGINLKMNEINSTRPNGQRVMALATGHVHVASRIRLPSGVVVMTNGALIPPDGFMVNGIGKLESTCSQTVWESTEQYVAGDYRELTVDTETDKDASLDKIIKPFAAF
jgi:hypothetical protein